MLDSVDAPTAAYKSDFLGFQTAKQISKPLEKQCHQQRIAAPVNYQNYNVFALAIILLFGIVTPVLAVWLTKWTRKVPRVDPYGYRYLSSRAEDLLQLHRMAMEGAGYDSWEGGIEEKPSTAKATQRLPQVVLEATEDSVAPILRYPRKKMTSWKSASDELA